MGEFWARLLARTQAQHLLLKDRAWLLDALYQWLGAMSSSAFRPFRHTATFVSLCIQTGLCDVAKALNGSWLTLSRQLENESSGRRSSGRLSGDKKLEALEEDKETLEEMMTGIFDGIFIHRHRDADPVIRAECVTALCLWIQKFPGKYLDPQYLRYVGWMLYDKVPSVRLEAIKSLNTLVVPSNLAGLRLFIDRFKKRILEMASSEVDSATRLLAIDVTRSLADLDLLDEEDAVCIVPLLFDSDSKVRQKVAPLIPGLLKEQQLTESDETPQLLKLLCQLLLYSMSLAVAEEEKSTDASKNANSRWNDMDFEEEEIFRARLQDQKDLVRWFKMTSPKPSSLPFGFEGIKEVVDVLWTVLPLVQEWQAIGDFLVESTTDDDSLALTPGQETCLSYLFVASATMSAEHSIRHKGNSDTMNGLTRGLMKLTPVLLRKYKNDYNEGSSKLNIILKGIRLMDFEMYLSLRMHTALNSLMNDLSNIFMKHTDKLVLEECAETFCFLLGSDEEEARNMSTSEPKSSQPSEQIKTVVSQKLKETLRQIIEFQIVPAYEELRSQSGDSDHCLTLRHALLRLSVLTAKLNIGSIVTTLSEFESPFSTWHELASGVVDVGLLTLSGGKNNASDSMVDETAFMIDSANQFILLILFWDLQSIYSSKKSGDAPYSLENIAFDQCSRLGDICEAIVTSEDSDDITFPLGLKVSVIKTMTTLYILMRSELDDLFKTRRDPPEIVQTKMTQVSERVIIAFCLLDRHAADFDEFKEGSAMEQLSPETSRLVRHELIKMATQMTKLVVIGCMDPSKAVFISKCFGLSNSPSNQSASTSLQIDPPVYLFGDVWDSLTSVIANETLIANLTKRLKLINYTDRNFLDILRDQLTSTSSFVFKSLVQSLDLYFSGLVPSLEPALGLTKTFLPHLKMWPTLMSPLKKHAYPILQSTLVGFLTDSCHNMVDRLVTFNHSGAMKDRRYSTISNFTTDSERDTSTATCNLASLAEVNAVWKIWGAIGGLVHHILDEMADEHGLDGGIFDDLKTELIERLSGAGIKPVSGNKDWESFWHFMKAIDKGDSSVGRIRKRSSAHKMEANTKRTKKGVESTKILPKKVKKVPTREEASELPLRRSDRRSSITTYMEDESEEEDEEVSDEEDSDNEAENRDPSASPNRTPVANRHPGPKSKIQHIAGKVASLDVQDTRYLEKYQDVLALSSIPKRKTLGDMELDFMSSPPSALSKKVRRI